MSLHLAYDRIQKFKAAGTAISEGVNYAHVVAPFLYDEGFIGFCKKAVFSTFYTTCIAVNESIEHDLLIYYSARAKHRKDYDYIPARLRELVENKCNYVESEEIFSLKQLFKTVTKFSFSWRLTRGYDAPVIQRFGCALLVAKYVSNAKTIALLLKGKRKVVTFCDAHAPENHLAQMANACGAVTFTNQHGQYRLLERNNISADAEAYANFVSSYMFCWGEATKREFSKFGFMPDQLVVTGWLKDWKANEAHVPSGVFGVMLNGENGRASNEVLLQTAKTVADSLNMRYLVRLHPWSKASQYMQYIDGRCADIGQFQLNDYLNSVEFSIAHMTAATIEILHAKAPVYLYDDGKLSEVFRVPNLSFSAVSQLVDSIVTDRLSPAMARRKFTKVYKWFNDDHEQASRIRTALFDEDI